MLVADCLRDLGRFDEAEAACRALVTDEPGNVAALRGFGQALRRRGDTAGALEAFRAALAAEPRAAWARMAVADALRDLGRFEEAEAACRALVADEPGNVAALRGLGHALNRRGDAAGALEAFRAALAIEPRAAWARMAAADALRDLGRLDEAEAAYRALVDDEPGNAAALMRLGRVAQLKADSSAASWFEQAVRADPDASAPRLALAGALRDLGDFGAARDALRAVLAREPAQVEAWMSLGHTERRAGRREAALEAFAHASGQAPDAAGPLVEMAVEERVLGRPEVSEELLRRALAADPGSTDAMQQLGEHLRLSDKLEAALEMFGRIIASSRPTVHAHMAASQALAELGELDGALRTLEDARARFGERPALAAKHAELLRRTGDWPAAREVVERAERSWPRHFGIWFERAFLERLRSGPEASAACLDAAPASSTPEWCRVHTLRGLFAADGWCFEEAAAHYERAIGFNPDDGWPRSCLAQTQLLMLDIDGAHEQMRTLSRLGFSAARLQGRSTNISQTLLGQLLDEFVLDRQALEELRALRGLAPDERVEPLRALVRRYPEHTPAAIALLTALRQSGRLGPFPAARAHTVTAAAPPRIPGAFAQYWDDADPPRDLAKLMASWGRLYPRFALRRFSDEQVRAFLGRFHTAEVQTAYRRSREPAQKADIFRLAYLYSHGGYYADADDRLVGDLEELRFPGADLVLYQEDIGTIGNNFIGAVPGHPLIGRALRLAVEAINRGDIDMLWLSTGPGMLTRAFAGLIAESTREPLAALDGVAVLEHVGLQRTVAIHCLAGYKKTERHWSRTTFGRSGAAKSSSLLQQAANGKTACPLA